MTGLDLRRDALIEVAALVTDPDLNVLGEGVDIVIHADDAVLVPEESIVAGMRLLLERAGLVVEPSAALGVAAMLEDPARFAGRHVVTVICGSNVDPAAYRRWVG